MTIFRSTATSSPLSRYVRRVRKNRSEKLKAEVQIAYAIGVAEPVSIFVDCFGTEKQSQEFLEGYIRENYDLTPRGIIEGLGLLDVDYNKVSAYGHFSKSGLPWEK